MSDSISRDDAKRIIDNIDTFCAGWRDYAMEQIDNLPTIDPVKRGRWIIRDNPGTGWYRVTCSECGEDVTSTIPMIGFFPNAKPLWDYCPWCGEKMGGEEGE